MYIPKYVARFQYEITKERVAEINTKYLNSIDYELDTFTQEVEHVDLEDYRFLVCVRERLFISKEEKGEDSIKISLIRPNEKSRFEVIKEINSDNHPWIEEVIHVGTILKGTSAPDYGTVNWYEGVGLDVLGVNTEINKFYIKLKAMILKKGDPKIDSLQKGEFAIPAPPSKLEFREVVGASKTLRAMFTLMSKRGFSSLFDNYHIDPEHGLEHLESLIFKLVADSRSNREDIFHLIQLWGGQTGRGFYVQNGSVDWDEYEIFAKYFSTYSEYNPYQATQVIRNLKNSSHQFGIAFITKHSRFWSEVSSCEDKYVIFDRNMSKITLGLETPSVSKLAEFWEGMKQASSDTNLSLIELERYLFNLFREKNIHWPRLY